MIQVDIAEPKEMLGYIFVGVEAVFSDLNQDGYADYRWTGESLLDSPIGEYHLERKTWQDIISNIDQVEDLLRRQQQAHPEAKHRLLIEGLGIEPTSSGTKLHTTKNKTVDNNVSYKKVIGWYSEVQRYMEVYTTLTKEATAVALCELYHHDQKPEEERKTFSRYAKEMVWRPNSQVSRMLGLALNDTNLGPTKCEALIKKFGSVFNVIKASPEELAEVPGIGKPTAVNFLAKIGRGDV